VQLSALGNTQKRSERLPWLAKKLLTALRNGLALFFVHVLSEPLFAESIKKRVLVRPANLGNLLAVQSVAIQ
jgi:hypothetical protein